MLSNVLSPPPPNSCGAGRHQNPAARAFFCSAARSAAGIARASPGTLASTGTISSRTNSAMVSDSSWRSWGRSKPWNDIGTSLLSVADVVAGALLAKGREGLGGILGGRHDGHVRRD